MTSRSVAELFRVGQGDEDGMERFGEEHFLKRSLLIRWFELRMIELRVAKCDQI